MIAWNLSDQEKIGTDDFEFFRGLIRQQTGIALSEAKRELVQARIRSHMTALGLRSFAEYRARLETPEAKTAGSSELQGFINALTTNKTEWFREIEHFHYLQTDCYPKWQATKREPLIWSAACSSGEEPYSLALHLSQHFSGQRYKILATDVDTNMVRIASNGVYPRSSLEQIPNEYRSYFSLGTGDIESWMKIRDQQKSHITFQPFNLMSSKYPQDGLFDLIFCRNVFIYFERDLVQSIVEKMYDVAAPGARLLIGHSESLQNLKTRWRFLRPSIFEKAA